MFCFPILTPPDKYGSFMTNARKSDLFLVVVTLLAAISWIFSKEAILLMPPLLFMGVRFLIAGGLLAIIAWRTLAGLSPDQVRRSLAVGSVFGIAMSFWIMGLFYGTSMGEGAFLTSLGVVIVPLVARCLFKEAQPTSTWLAVPIAIFGLALLSLKNGFHPQPWQLLFVLSACIFALYFTLVTRATNQRTIVGPRGENIHKQRISALPLTAIVLSTVGLITLAASLALEYPALASVPFTDPELIGWVLASAVIGTSGRFLLQTYAQSLSPHSHGVVILILEPVWVALFAASWFGESMTPIQIAGCGVIFTALIVNRWGVFSRAIKEQMRIRKSS